MRTRTPTLALGIVLLTTGGALADGERLFFEVSNEISPDRPSAVVTLWAGFDPSDYAMAGVATEVRASEGNWFALELIPPMDGPGTTPGVRTGGGSVVGGILAGQLNFPGDIYADPTNPIAFWQAEIEVFDFTPRTIDLATDTSRFDVYIDMQSSSSRAALADLEEAMATVVVVPAPAAPAALLAPVLLAGLRRRRR